MYISCRVVLNDQQRLVLKNAYQEFLKNTAPETPQLGASRQTTRISVNQPIQTELPGILMTDLLNTRESMPLETVIRIQRAFGVEVITPEDVMAQAKEYTNYMFRNSR